MNLTEKILQALKSSPYWHQRTRITGNTIQGLVCPVCGDKSAWAYSDSPMSVNCNKLGSCSARTRTLELFNIRQDIEKEFKPTKADPHRPARAYLESRGIKNSLKGLDFEYWPNVRKTGSGAVMFPVGKDEKGKPVYNGRLINPPPGEGKTHNSNSTAGQYWKYPGIKYNPNQQTYVTEGILDALSLIEIGHQAIAVLSAGQDPGKVDLSEFNKLVFAFDPDDAGAKATKKWLEAYSEASCIMPDKGMDWNDLLQSGPPDTVKSNFSANYERYQVNAKLALTETAREYVDIYRSFYNNVPGLFTFNNGTYFSSIRKKGDDTHVQVEQCGKFAVQVQSYLVDRSCPDQPDFRYHLKIIPKNGRPVTATATGRDLASSLRAREFFLTRARVAWSGGSQATTALGELITSSRKAPEVRQLILSGYDVSTGLYLFHDYAVDATGSIQKPDKCGLHKISAREWVKIPPHASDKAIRPASQGPPVKEIYKLLTAAYGDNAAAAVAWCAASWFVNQVKDQVGWFPFLSLYGDVQAGKSALTTMLNAIQGLNTEGFPISQLSTKKALARSIARESGRFTALLEDNQRNDRAFDFSVLLTGFNRGPLQLQAAFSNDLRTSEAPFQGALLFVQNTEPFNSKAEKERVISLYFKHDHLTDQTRAAYDKLIKIPLSQLARVMVTTLQQRKAFEENWIKEYEKAVEDLSEVDNRRILQNHALLLAFHRLFCRVHKINHNLTGFIQNTAVKKVESAAAQEYTVASHFFETLDLLDDEKTKTCIHIDEKTSLLYLNLPAVEQLIRNKGAQFAYHDNLGKALKSHPAFVKSNHKYRFPADPKTDIEGRTIQRRVWIFDCTKFD
jgi:hypothetical protein